MPGRILIAHPGPEERTRIGGVVRACGYQPVEAASGQDALARAEGVVAALLLATLPAGDGLATAGRLAEGSGDGPALFLLNDVYPIEEPRERWLRDFGLAGALPAPPDPQRLAGLLGRLERRPRRARRESPRTTDLADIPLLLLLGRARRKVETGLLYAARDGEAIFVVLNRGDVAAVRANRPEAGGDEALIAAALGWSQGHAALYPDPRLEETAPARLDLLPLLDRATSAPNSATQELAERWLARSHRVVLEPAEGSAELAEVVGLSHFERHALDLFDGDRSVARVAGLASTGSLPIAELLLRLEALGLLVPRRPGPRPARRAGTAPQLLAAAVLLPLAAEAPIAASGRLGPSELARLLLRLEAARSSGVLALRRGPRTVEMALVEGHIRGVHAWGGEGGEDEPVRKLAGLGELRPEDVPKLRRLHAQRLVLEALAAPELHWVLRPAGASRSREPLDVNPAAFVAEALRAAWIAPEPGPPPPVDQLDAVIAALRLRAGEARALRRWCLDGDPPWPEWLTRLGPLLDPAAPIGRSLDLGRALAAAPVEESAEDDLERLFERALDEGLRRSTQAGAPRARPDGEAAKPSPGAPARAASAPARADGKPPEETRSFELDLSAPAGAPSSFTLDQGPGGVVIRIGDRDFAIDALIAEVDALRTERARLAAELARRQVQVAEGQKDAAGVRHTVAELEDFIAELRATILEREQAYRQLTVVEGERAVALAELQAVVPEKDRWIGEALARTGEIEAQLARAHDQVRERERVLDDLRRERDGLRERLTRLDAELGNRAQLLSESLEQAAKQRERGLRLERDLQSARAERDELTARLVAAEGEKRRRGFFRDARPERTGGEDLERTLALADQRRRELDAIRAEATTHAHRIIDLEGQVARRETEAGRLLRERERLEERLQAAEAEAAARGEGEAANRRRREEAEELLREKTRLLEVRAEQIEGHKRLRDELHGQLESLQHVAAERDGRLEQLSAERSELVQRLGAAETEAARLATDSASRREQHERLLCHADEQRQTIERATATLEALRSARDEIATRLGEALAKKARAEEERERVLAEARRLDGELKQERETGNQERARLEGLLAAREQQSTALERYLAGALAEAGALADRTAALATEHNQARVAGAAAAERAAALGREVQRLQHELATAEAERRRSGELQQALVQRDAKLLELEALLQEGRAEVEARAREIRTLTDRLQAEKLQAEENRRAERIALAEERRRDSEAAIERHRHSLEEQAAEHKQARTALEKALADRNQRLLATQSRLAEAVERESEHQSEAPRREAALRALAAQLERAVSERRVVAEEIQAQAAARTDAVASLEAELARVKQETARDLAASGAAKRDLEARLARISAESSKLRELSQTQRAESERLEAQVAQARRRVAQDVRRISELAALVEELRARLGERESHIQARSAEADSFRETAAERERKLAEAREQMLALSEHDRELSQQLAEQEELIANLKADMQRLEREKAQGLADVVDKLRQGRARTEAQARTIEDLRRELERSRETSRLAQARAVETETRSREAARAAERRERALRTLLNPAAAEAAAAATGEDTSSSDEFLVRSFRDMQNRLAELERDRDERMAAEAALRAEEEALLQELGEATAALEQAQRDTTALAGDLESRGREASRNATRQRDLEAAVALAEDGQREQARLREHISRLEGGLRDRDEAFALLDSTLAAREALVEELERRLEIERARGEARGQAPFQAELEKARAALAAAAEERTLHQDVRGQLDAVLAERTRMLAEISRLRQDAAAAAQAASSARATPAQPSPALGADTAPFDLQATEQERRAVEAEAERRGREIVRLREVIERKAQALAKLEARLGYGVSDARMRGEIESLREVTEEELNTLKGSLGVATARVAELNRKIVELNRRIQQHLERQGDTRRSGAGAGAAVRGGVEAMARLEPEESQAPSPRDRRRDR